MKKYLFGLGAMLIGAGLMFVFTHTEVNATSNSSEDDIEIDCPRYKVKYERYANFYEYCQIKDLTCVRLSGRVEGFSCVKSG